MADPTKEWWWLSFADPTRPEGDQFLGVAIVDTTAADRLSALPTVAAIRAANNPPPVDRTALAIGAAVSRAHQLGCNPGGEVQCLGPIPDGYYPTDYCHRLLTRPECEHVDRYLEEHFPGGPQ